MFTADQLVAHLVGDYVLQSHWMATEKTKRTVAAAAHALCYTLPFLALTSSPGALAAICLSHFAIDRWRLARYVVWLKNWLGLPRRDEREEIVSFMPTSFDVVEDGIATRGEGIVKVVRRWVLPNRPWAKCKGTGYPDDTPAWLAVWLLIIADNTLHILCNAAAIRWLA